MSGRSPVSLPLSSDSPPRTSTNAVANYETPTRVEALARRRSTTAWRLAGLIAVATLIRGIFLWARGDYLDYDEAMYLLLARNLLDGKGFALNGLPHTALGPFVPLASATIVRLSGVDLLLAQRALTAVAGAFALLPIWALARSRAGERIAWMAAILLVAWPALIDVAPKFGPMWSHMYAGSEPTHLFLLFAALALGEAAFRRQGRVGFALAATAGAVLGLAYLTRAETVVFAGFYAVLTTAETFRLRTGLRRRLTVLGFAGLGFVAVATPHLSYLHRVSGAWILSGQTAVMGPAAETLQDMFRDDQHLERYVRTWYRLDGAHTHLLNPYWGTPEGLDRELQADRFARVAAMEYPVRRSWPARLVNRLTNFSLMLWSLSGALLLPLAALGLAVGRSRALPAFAIAGLGASLATGVVLAVLPRFFLYLVPALAVSAAWGIEAVARGFPRLRPVAPRLAILGLVAAGLVEVGLRAQGDRATSLRKTAESDRVAAEAISAAWGTDEPFMHWQPRFAVWAGWEWRPLPVASLDAIAHYCSQIGVKRILLTQVGYLQIRGGEPYLAIQLDPDLLASLKALDVRRGQSHEHPQIELSKANDVAGYQNGKLSLHEELSE